MVPLCFGRRNKNTANLITDLLRNYEAVSNVKIFIKETYTYLVGKSNGCITSFD